MRSVNALFDSGVLDRVKNIRVPRNDGATRLLYSGDQEPVVMQPRPKRHRMTSSSPGALRKYSQEGMKYFIQWNCQRSDRYEWDQDRDDEQGNIF
jgi:hypothetical protein